LRLDRYSFLQAGVLAVGSLRASGSGCSVMRFT